MARLINWGGKENRKKLRLRNRRIYRRWIDGVSQSDLARQYGVSRQRIHSIINREAMRP